MSYRKPLRLRIHLTNGKNSKIYKWVEKGRTNRTTYDVTYCGKTFESFGGAYNHSVYTFGWYVKLGAEHEQDICPDCLASSELGLDILGL